MRKGKKVQNWKELQLYGCSVALVTLLKEFWGEKSEWVRQWMRVGMKRRKKEGKKERNRERERKMESKLQRHTSCYIHVTHRTSWFLPSSSLLRKSEGEREREKWNVEERGEGTGSSLNIFHGNCHRHDTCNDKNVHCFIFNKIK